MEILKFTVTVSKHCIFLLKLCPRPQYILVRNPGTKPLSLSFFTAAQLQIDLCTDFQSYLDFHKMRDPLHFALYVYTAIAHCIIKNNSIHFLVQIELCFSVTTFKTS